MFNEDDKMTQETVMLTRENIRLYDIEYLKAIFDFIKFIIKAAFTINGGAALAILTLITNALLKEPELSNQAINSCYWFSYGCFVAVIAAFPIYLSIVFFKRTEYCENIDVYNVQLIREANSVVNKAAEQANINPLGFIQEVGTHEAYVEDSTTKINTNRNEYHRNRNYAYFWMFIGVVAIIISFVLFIFGLNTVKNTFSKNFKSANQVVVCNNSSTDCHRVSIHPLPLTKPN